MIKSKKDRDRTMDLKREIYLDVAKAIVINHNSLLKLSDLDIQTESLREDFHINSAVIGKMHLIANEETIEAVSKFSVDLDSAYLQLIILRKNVILKKMDAEMHKDILDGFKDAEKRFLRLMEEHNLNVEKDYNKFEAIKRQFDNNRSFIDEYTKKHLTILKELNNEHVAYSNLCTQKYRKIFNLIPEIVFKIRHELEFEIDEDEYMRIFKDSIERSEKNMQTFFSELGK